MLLLRIHWRGYRTRSIARILAITHLIIISTLILISISLWAFQRMSIWTSFIIRTATTTQITIIRIYTLLPLLLNCLLLILTLSISCIMIKTIPLQLLRRLIIFKYICCLSISLISFMILKSLLCFIMSLNKCISLMTWNHWWLTFLIGIWFITFLLIFHLSIVISRWHWLLLIVIVFFLLHLEFSCDLFLKPFIEIF